MLDLYDVHSVITSQIASQLLYWLGAELFNRIMSSRKYLARTKAMQIRMNISTLEDWARHNNRQPEHYEHGEMKSSGENTVEAARRHLAPVIQMLQWLQCFSSLGADDLEALVGTLQQLRALSPQQLIHAAQHYRPEVGEKGLPKSAMKYLAAIQKETILRRENKQRAAAASPKPKGGGSDSAPATPSKKPNGNGLESFSRRPARHALAVTGKKRKRRMRRLRTCCSIPRSCFRSPYPARQICWLVTEQAFGGVNRERERKYIPTVPPEFLEKLETSGAKKGPMFEERDWEDEEV